LTFALSTAGSSIHARVAATPSPREENNPSTHSDPTCFFSSKCSRRSDSSCPEARIDLSSLDNDLVRPTRCAGPSRHGRFCKLRASTPKNTPPNPMTSSFQPGSRPHSDFPAPPSLFFFLLFLFLILLQAPSGFEASCLKNHLYHLGERYACRLGRFWYQAQFRHARYGVYLEAIGPAT